MIGIYCLWMGLLRIAEKSGMIQAIARGSERLICKLFTGIRQGSEAVSLITLNLVANMLGMGNAATPFGLRAMAALQEQNPDKRQRQRRYVPVYRHQHGLRPASAPDDHCRPGGGRIV